MDAHIFLCHNNGLIIFPVQDVIEYTKSAFKGVCQTPLRREKMKANILSAFVPRFLPFSISSSFALRKIEQED